MFWRRKKTSDPIDDSRFAPAGAAAPAPNSAAPPAAGDVAGGSTLLVDDVFTITGRGTVVTGAVESGTLRAGQQVAVYRGGQAIAGSEIQAVEAAKKLIDVAQVGENVGLLLPGLSRDVVQPGDQVVAAD